MEDSSKFLAGLIIGAAAGTALALFLQTDKGKEVIDNIKDTASGAGDSLRKKMQDFDEELNALLKKGKQFVEELEKKASEAMQSE